MGGERQPGRPRGRRQTPPGLRWAEGKACGPRHRLPPDPGRGKGPPGSQGCWDTAGGWPVGVGESRPGRGGGDLGKGSPRARALPETPLLRSPAQVLAAPRGASWTGGPGADRPRGPRAADAARTTARPGPPPRSAAAAARGQRRASRWRRCPAGSGTGWARCRWAWRSCALRGAPSCRCPAAARGPRPRSAPGCPGSWRTRARPCTGRRPCSTPCSPSSPGRPARRPPPSAPAAPGLRAPDVCVCGGGRSGIPRVPAGRTGAPHLAAGVRGHKARTRRGAPAQPGPDAPSPAAGVGRPTARLPPGASSAARARPPALEADTSERTPSFPLVAQTA